MHTFILMELNFLFKQTTGMMLNKTMQDKIIYLLFVGIELEPHSMPINKTTVIIKLLLLSLIITQLLLNCLFNFFLRTFISLCQIEINHHICNLK